MVMSMTAVRAAALALALALAPAKLGTAAAAGRGVTVLSNTAVPRDTDGKPLITGETSVLGHGGALYFYVNNWGTCTPVDCCPSSGGCASCCYVPPSASFPDACVFVANHTVSVYRTTDLQSWTNLGVALSLSARPHGIEFRPHVVHNANTGKYVMWFEDRPHPISSSGYSVAVANNPAGPFVTVATSVKMADVPGDFDVLVDDDGTAYHVQTTTNDPQALDGFVVTVLSHNYTAPATPKRSTHFRAPLPAEGPVFFKRAGAYYILGGTTCCACRGGSSVYVFRAPSPLGPWSYVADVGSNRQPYDPHSPANFVTHAQASTVFRFDNHYVWLGNQWVTSAARNADLLYWSVLNFTDSGDIAQFVWQDTVTLPAAPAVVV